MNIAYFRKSKFSFEETSKNTKDLARKGGLKVVGIDLTDRKDKLLAIYNNAWIGSLITLNKNLFGLLPCQLVVLKNKDLMTVGVSDPSILGSVTQNPAVKDIFQEAEKVLKNLVDKVTGSGSLKPVKIKLYSTTCPYCQMEKVWFDSKKVKHGLVYVDFNPEEVENLFAKTGQMGVPVTEIIYCDAEPEFVIGFDKPKLARILGIKE